jgi:hypothetical protein
LNLWTDTIICGAVAGALCVAANISQTSTYLVGTRTDDHSDMERYEANQAALQRFATGAKSEGRKREPSSGRREQKARKSADGSHPAIM